MALNKRDVLDRSWAYLRDLHSKDPRGNPATVKALAEHLGVNRGTLYNWLKKGDGDVDALLRAIEQSDKSVKGDTATLALASSDTRVGEGVSTLELEREIMEALRTIAFRMRGFVSLVENTKSPVEAPLLVAQLEAKLQQLKAMARDLEGPYGVWYARKLQEAGTDATEDRGPAQDGTRDLDYNSDNE